MPIEIDLPDLEVWPRPSPRLGDLVVKAFGNEENLLGIVLEVKHRESPEASVTLIKVLTHENYITEWIWAFTDLISSLDCEESSLDI